MPLVILKHVDVGLVLEHPLRSFISLCVAEGPFYESYNVVVDYILNDRVDVLECHFTPTKHKENSAQIF